MTFDYHALLQKKKVCLMQLYPRADEMHSHRFFELVYVLRGSALHQLGAQLLRVHEGDYFIVDCGSFHRYQEIDGFEIINCLFLPEFIDPALANCPSLSALLSSQLRQFDAQALDAPSADRIYYDVDGGIRHRLQTMHAEQTLCACGYLEMIRSHLIYILVHMLRSPAESARLDDRHPAVAAMAEYLYDHFAQPLSLRTLAAQLGYTAPYLSALFRRETGMSPSDYLQRLRVERSCRLLTESDLRIAQIAQEVGYGDLKRFDLVFRRHMDVSPRQYRTQHTPLPADDKT